jgi:hypothetical protein
MATEENGWSGQNYGGFANAEYDAVCSTQLQSLPGEAAYESAAKEAQLMFGEQLPGASVPAPRLAATRPDMCNFIMDPTANSEMWNLENFDYGEGCE